MIDQLGNGLLLGIIISVASVALSLLYGVTRIVNFAHGEIIALGAIVTLFFSGPIDSRVLFLERFSPLGMSFVTSAIIGIIFCGVFGGLLEFLLFRPLRKAEVGNIAVLVVTIGLSILNFKIKFFIMSLNDAIDKILHQKQIIEQLEKKHNLFLQILIYFS